MITLTPREEMAVALVDTMVDLQPHEGCTLAEFHRRCSALDQAARELRKTCGTCANWQDDDACPMGVGGSERLPSDGSGHCHEWEQKQSAGARS